MSNNDAIKQLVLENAVKYKGKADKKFVFGAALANIPEYRTKQDELHEILDAAIAEINALSIEQQKQELENEIPIFLKRKKRLKEIFLLS